MAIKDFIKEHRTWEDGVGLVLGLMISLSPWFYDEPEVPIVVLNSAVTGVAVMLLAQLEFTKISRWKEFAQLACGLWLVIAPSAFDYSHQDHLRFWHWGLGLLVLVLAIFELWQSRKSKLPRT